LLIQRSSAAMILARMIKFGRRLSAATIGLSLMLLGLPTAASAQIVKVDPATGSNPSSVATTPEKAGPPVNGVTIGVGGLDPSRHIVVNISDTGFEKDAYTVLTTLGMSGKSDIGTVEFKNTGTKVHTATAINGTGYLRVAEPNYERCNKRTCNSDGPLDTGGIAPGQSVVVALQYTGSVQLTSSTDCPPFQVVRFGTPASGFDCVPVNLTVKPTALSNILNSSMEGTIHHNADGSLSKVRTFNSIKGAPNKPLTGNVTVTIDDEDGYDPTTLYITTGTTVTWVNKPSNKLVHAVRARVPPAPNPDKIHLLWSSIAPGETYSYYFDCAPDPGCTKDGGYNTKVYSLIATDWIPNNVNGSSTSNGYDSRFVMRIVTIKAPSA
jgi:plastocyanin